MWTNAILWKAVLQSQQDGEAPRTSAWNERAKQGSRCMSEIIGQKISKPVILPIQYFNKMHDNVHTEMKQFSNMNDF